MKKLVQSKLARYLLVGGSAFVTEYCSFIVLYQLLGMQTYIANSISFCLGLTVSFLFNRGWTFKPTQSYKMHVHHQLAAYISLAIFNLITTNLIIGVLKAVSLDPRLGKISAMLFVAAWNFLIFRILIFAEHGEAK
jgi:putative flippase GtrA